VFITYVPRNANHFVLCNPLPGLDLVPRGDLLRPKHRDEHERHHGSSSHAAIHGSENSAASAAAKLRTLTIVNASTEQDPDPDPGVNLPAHLLCA
jgi:hypothetical protein